MRRGERLRAQAEAEATRAVGAAGLAEALIASLLQGAQGAVPAPRS